MSFRFRDRPQNQHPDRLVQSRKATAQQNYEAVRVTVQAMRRRGTQPAAITVQAVAKESHVSVATIYRRDDLLTLVRRANPDVQHRQKEEKYKEKIGQLKQAVTQAQEQATYHKQEAGLAKLDDRKLQQENIRLKKLLLKRENEIALLEAQLANCTCGAKDRLGPHLLQGGQ
jgi:hypothetical protein